MKQSNLEKAKKGHPVITKDGMEARIICSDVKNEEYPIVVLVTDNIGTEDADTYTDDGYFTSKKVDSPHDLRMKQEEKTVKWINRIKYYRLKRTFLLFLHSVSNRICLIWIAIATAIGFISGILASFLI